MAVHIEKTVTYSIVFILLTAVVWWMIFGVPGFSAPRINDVQAVIMLAGTAAVQIAMLRQLNRRARATNMSSSGLPVFIFLGIGILVLEALLFTLGIILIYDGSDWSM